MDRLSPLTLDDVLLFPPSEAWCTGATTPDLSPDGRWIAYAYRGDVWLVETTGHVLQRVAAGAAPRWSPATPELAFLRGEPVQIWIRNTDGTERQLTYIPDGVTRAASGRSLDFAWSSDGRRIASITAAGTPTPAPVGHDFSYLPPQHTLWVTTVASAASRLVAQAAPGVMWSSPAWSPDGRHLALREMAFFATKGDVQNVLAVVDVDTGRIQYPLGRTKRQVFTPEWAPDGLRLAVPYSPHDSIHPFRLACGGVPAGESDVACLASAYFIAPFHSLCWHPDNRTIFCCGARGITTQVVRVDTATGSVRPVTNAPGIHEHLRCSAHGTRLVCTYRTLTSVPEVYLLSADGRERRQVTHVGDRLLRVRLARAEVVRWRAPDGLEIKGVLVTPPKEGPERGYPTIVDLHGGPVACPLAEFYPEWHWLAAQGYQVYAPDFRGSQRYGCAAPPMEPQDAADVLAGVDRLVERDAADEERLGVRGHSYGAGLAALPPGHTRRFRAVVLDGAGAHHPDTVTVSPGAQTPTLLLQGERDNQEEIALLSSWLRRAGGVVEVVVYPGEGHWITAPAHRSDFWRRTLAWFDQYVRARCQDGSWWIRPPS